VRRNALPKTYYAFARRLGQIESLHFLAVKDCYLRRKIMNYGSINVFILAMLPV